jgi:hypothetical protein
MIRSASAASTCRTMRPGTPITSERGGTCIPSGITAPAATTLPVPMRTPLSRILPMPIRHSSSTVHPCRITRWPTPTRRPTVHGSPSSTWTMVPSWRLLSGPMTIGAMSPRSTAPYQTLASSPIVTSPITAAPGAMNAEG